ncbi:hypothetical protein [Kordiimonas sp.]|uniref:hypothetical protein n=1 Tax=Kordiimonas sp. TaxID=1970157 RepID=UPI003A930E4A
MKRLVLTALLLGTAACQNTHTRPTVAPQFMRVGPLAESNLSDKCGLALKARSGTWANTGAVVLFQQTGNTGAVIALDGASRQLTQTRATRDSIDGFPSLQAFRADGMTARLSVRFAKPDETEEGDTHVGVLMVNKTDGWSTTIPVSGTISCK